MRSLRDDCGYDSEYVWHRESSVDGFDAIVIPGGFSYGDYLRCGAISRFANVMQAVKKAADEGKPVLGVCNGFQILTEAGLLPGALIRNNNLKFMCKTEELVVANNNTMFTSLYEQGEVIRIPIAHGEGNYYCYEETLARLEENKQIAFRYVNNPNGSVADIAGVTNERGNVLGMMPHPERAVDSLLGGNDGLNVFKSILKAWRESHVVTS